MVLRQWPSQMVVNKSWIDAVRVKLDEVDASKVDLVDEKTTIRPAAKLLDRQQHLATPKRTLNSLCLQWP